MDEKLDEKMVQMPRRFGSCSGCNQLTWLEWEILADAKNDRHISSMGVKEISVDFLCKDCAPLRVL